MAWLGSEGKCTSACWSSSLDPSLSIAQRISSAWNRQSLLCVCGLSAWLPCGFAPALLVSVLSPVSVGWVCRGVRVRGVAWSCWWCGVVSCCAGSSLSVSVTAVFRGAFSLEVFMSRKDCQLTVSSTPHVPSGTLQGGPQQCCLLRSGIPLFFLAGMSDVGAFGRFLASILAQLICVSLCLILSSLHSARLSLRR